MRDDVYIGTGFMTDDLQWVKPKMTRTHGVVVRVDRDNLSATVRMHDHKYADKDEPKVFEVDFAVFEGCWNSKRDGFILSVELIDL